MLLSKLYRVEFTSGNNNLLKKIQDSKEDMVVYIDVPPKLDLIYNMYVELDRLALDIRETSKRRVYIIPIPCMEHFILKCLKQLNVELEYNHTFLYDIYKIWEQGKGVSNKVPKKYGYSGKFNDFERLCKALLSNAGTEFHNVVSDKAKEGVGNFYTQDSHGNTVENKSLLLGKHFIIVTPNKYCLDNYKGHFRNTTDIDTLITEYTTQYMDWYTKYEKVELEDTWTNK